MVDILKLSCFQFLKMNLCPFCVLEFTELATGFIMEFAGKYRVVFLKVSKIPFVCVRVNLN